MTTGIMGDKIRHLSSTSGYQNLFSAGLSMSPIVWDSILTNGSSQDQQQVFNFDDQTTSRWRQQQQQQGVKSKCNQTHSRSGRSPRARKQNKGITDNAENSAILEQSNEEDEDESKFRLEFI